MHANAERRFRAPIVALLALPAAVALPLGAAPTPAPHAAATSTATAQAPATVTLDPVHSVALFRIQHLEAGLFWGRFKALEGKATWTLDSK